MQRAARRLAMAEIGLARLRAMSAAIRVLAIRHLDGRSSVKAFVDIQVGGFKILSAKIVKQDGTKAWLAMPSVKGDGTGRRAWITPVEITSKTLRDRLTQAAVEAWQSASGYLQHESSKS
jgi:DNA-binding cell septation regulator SpoVG